MKKDEKKLKKANSSFRGKEYQSYGNGYFGTFGGIYVPEILVSALKELRKITLSIKG